MQLGSNKQWRSETKRRLKQNSRAVPLSFQLSHFFIDELLKSITLVLSFFTCLLKSTTSLSFPFWRPKDHCGAPKLCACSGRPHPRPVAIHH